MFCAFELQPSPVHVVHPCPVPTARGSNQHTRAPVTLTKGGNARQPLTPPALLSWAQVFPHTCSLVHIGSSSAVVSHHEPEPCSSNWHPVAMVKDEREESEEAGTMTPPGTLQGSVKRTERPLSCHGDANSYKREKELLGSSKSEKNLAWPSGFHGDATVVLEEAGSPGRPVSLTA